MKILFLTNLLPYPLDNGGKIKTYTTLNALYKAGYDIDLVCFTEDIKINDIYLNIVAKLCNSISISYLKLTSSEHKCYMIKKAIESIFSKYSFGVYKYKSKKMIKILNNIDKNKKYDCVYFDHLQMCIYMPEIKKIFPNARYILDEHNCERLIVHRNRQTSKNLVKKSFLLLEEIKIALFEKNIIKKMDLTILLSKADYNNLYKNIGEFNYEIIPVGVNDKGVKKHNINGTKLNILFIGTLTWEPNNTGLIWFLDNVIPLLEENKIEYNLYIVGKNPSEYVVKKSKMYRNIFITGYVKSVDEYYDKCDCMIVPLFSGSGQRVKLIEAFSKGMPSISTSIGAEGLFYKENEDILIANTSKDFFDKILSLKNEKLRNKLSENSRKIFEKYYSMEVISKKISKVVGAILLRSLF